MFVHEGVVEEGELTMGLALELDVDHERRRATRANHSATHILHEALRQVLGDHVAQKGSLVAPDRLRFDFTHPKPLSDEELAEVERIANLVVQDNAAVETRLMAQRRRHLLRRPRAVRREIRRRGARRLHGPRGRRAARGRSRWSCAAAPMSRAPATSASSPSSRESAVASGVRRIEARTAEGARAQFVAQARALRDIAALMRAPLEEAPARLALLLDERKRLERELADAKRQLAMGGGGGAAREARDIAGVKLLSRAVSGIESKDLKALVDDAKKAIGSGVVAIATASPDGKAGIVVGVTDDLTRRFNAVDFVRVASEILGGKGGGGRPDLAQAGGPDAGAIDAALAAIEETLRNKAAP